MISLSLIDRDTVLPGLYPELESWWRGHGWPAVPLAILPRLGVLASHGTRPVAAAWLYMDNSVGVSMLEWTVTNPSAAPREAAVAISRIVEFLQQEARALDYGVMLTTCRQESLARLLQRAGFRETDREMIHLVATL